MVKTSNTAAERQIRKMVSRIVKRFAPDRIILFGSLARRAASPDSDVDLLVVMKVKRSKREASLAIRRLLHDIPMPMDIVVTSAEEFEWRKDIVGTIEYPATHEGRSLYEKP
jgi:predicted nucleotidyltransferase